MFVTSRFVFLHQPKTGGTFVTAVLSRLHEAQGDRVETVYLDPDRLTEAPAPQPGRAFKVMIGPRHQHGRRADIPTTYAGLPVVATIRNPYDRYASQYEFGWWRRAPDMFGPVAELSRQYPRYPDLTFEEFVRLTNAVSVPACPGRGDDRPGFHTYQFLESFARDPDGAWRRLCDGAPGAAWDAGTEDMAFLDQSRLNDALYAWLLRMGYPRTAVAFVRQADRILPPEGGRTAEQHWTRYYDPALKAFVRHRERLLFDRFPQFDV